MIVERTYVFEKIAVLLMMMLFIAACSSNNGKETYANSEANRIQTTLTGTVEDIAIVNIDGASSWKGTLTGSILGGVLGSTIGSGWGRVISSAAGSIGGSFAGAGVERQLTKDEGLKMAVRQDNGNSFTVIVVPEKGETFKIGDKVRVVSSSSGKVNVYHLGTE